MAKSSKFRKIFGTKGW